MSITSIDPFTGKVLKRFRAQTGSHVERALAASQAAFRTWRSRELGERAAVLQRAARALRRDKHLPQLITNEMGKPITQAKAEIEKCAWACEYYATNGAAILAPEAITTEAQRSYVRFEPLGAVLAVMPWNFPFWQVFRFAAPTLMAGNVVLLKHASNVPQCALQIAEIWRRAKAPEGVFQTLLVDSSATKRIIADPRVAAVTLTGSGDAGRAVAGIAGRALKKVVLELGGSDPFIVLRDADLDLCAAVAAQARTINSGQSCIAAKRFIVEAAVASRFTALLVEAMQALRVGNPSDARTEVGPLARADLVGEIDRQVRRSVRRGARLLIGGTSLPGPGFFYLPTVLADVRPGMPAYDEELFGPVASVIVARDAGDAIRIANDSRFGLGASLWTQDLAHAEVLCAGIEAGIVYVNDLVKSDPRLPFGGVKESGYGRELGTYGIKELTNIKTVVVK